jgi:ariadne-1
MVESPIEDDTDISDLRQRTTDKRVYCEQRYKILLEDTLKGYEEVSFFFPFGIVVPSFVYRNLCLQERWIWSDPIKL